MAHPHISAVTIGYRGASHHFVTVADAVRFLRGDDIRTGWFRKVTALNIHNARMGFLRKSLPWSALPEARHQRQLS
jgi:hypothetical protein